jgi:hypothetical protein
MQSLGIALPMASERAKTIGRTAWSGKHPAISRNPCGGQNPPRQRRKDAQSKVVSAALLIAFHFDEFPSQLSPDFLPARWRPMLRLTALRFPDLFLCGLHWLDHLPPPWMQR